MAPKTHVQQLSLENVKEPFQQLSNKEVDYQIKEQTELVPETPRSLEGPRSFSYNIMDATRSENTFKITEEVVSLSKDKELLISV